MFPRTAFASLGSIALALMLFACASGCDGTSGASTSNSDDALTTLRPEEIVGNIRSGETSAVIAYSGTPRYRALKLIERKGKKLDVWVRSPDGDARTWLLDKNFQVVATSYDADATTKDSHIQYKLAQGGTYYIAFREENYRAASFTVAFNAKTSAPVPVPGAGPVKLRIPLVASNGRMLSDYNSLLASQGMRMFPPTVEVDAQTGATAFGEWYQYAMEASASIGIDFELTAYGTPSDYSLRAPDPSICYTGSGRDVAKLVASLADGPFSDQLSVYSWRYKAEKGSDVVNLADEDFSAYPSDWTDWSGDTEDVLLITSTSDDGDERDANWIPKCE